MPVSWKTHSRIGVCLCDAAAVPESWPDDERRWSEVKAQLAPAIQRFEPVEQALDRAGIPREPGFLGIDRATLEATFRHATRLRARYTTVDFLEGQGALDAAIATTLAVSAAS